MTWQYRGTLAQFSLFKPLVALLQPAPRPPAPRHQMPTITFIETPAEEKPKTKPDRAFIETDENQADRRGDRRTRSFILTDQHFTRQSNNPTVRPARRLTVGRTERDDVDRSE